MIRAYMISAALALLAAFPVLITGCTVVPAATAHQTCELLNTALDEAQMAEAWYIEAGKVLKRCGIENATERADSKACYARRFNDSSVVCE